MLESYDDQFLLNMHDEANNQLTIYTSPKSRNSSIDLSAETDVTSFDLNDHYVSKTLNSLDENIILCWESYSIPLQDLVKTVSIYERNMLEYYRLIILKPSTNSNDFLLTTLVSLLQISIEFILQHVLEQTILGH